MVRGWEERNLWVGNLPYSVTAAEIQSLFDAVAPVVSVRLRLDPTTGESRGCGYVEFSDPETCRLVKLSMTGVELHGRPLRLDWATPLAKRGQQEVPRNPKPRSTSPMPAKTEAGVLSRLTDSHILLLVAETQQLARENPVIARRVLNDYPQLRKALLQGLLVAESLQRVVPDAATRKRPRSSSPERARKETKHQDDDRTWPRPSGAAPRLPEIIKPDLRSERRPEGSIVDGIIDNPEVLARMLETDAERAPFLSAEEKVQVRSIQRELASRGLNVLYPPT
ncbi:MAG: uncharacterized protein KVP18_000654 [Porospora cf. gigantea A]|uniref:uncharacterized protein n=1 Tax=Porospora cf. gigantea A TaxID=2853593 RepID=UPI00355A18D6|nr:MAG: hypothetical protein KVP18_000654 [Porospora cf. gigantea A]